MSELSFKQRKVVNIHWDTDEVKGHSVSISTQNTANDEEEGAEVRNVDNDGYATVTFPADYVGDCYVVVKGSKGGEQTGTVSVK